MAAKKPRGKAAKGHQLPEPIPTGFEIKDATKQAWLIHKVIGSGGFGTVYFAADAKKPKDDDYVIKVEFHGNGPLFAEMHCYQKIAKPSTLSEWMKKKKLKYLGLSPCYGFGSFEFNSSRYRFMVLERFDKDLDKLFIENNRRFPLKTVCLVGSSVIDVLEYIHSCGYVHGDIKAANLLTGYKKGTQNQVYLVDMGLACKYLKDGVHKPDNPDPKKAHNGTPEFTSRDAHRGSFSRRSDLEILVWNLLQWLVGRLPWEDFINDNIKLQKEKERHMADVNKFLKLIFGSQKCPEGISKLAHYVSKLSFTEEPDYKKCKQFLMDDLKSIGCLNDSTLEFKTKKTPQKRVSKTPKTPAKAVPEKPAEISNKENGKDKKIVTKAAAKRKGQPTEIQFEAGTVLTPAMQAILDKRQTETSNVKQRKKK